MGWSDVKHRPRTCKWCGKKYIPTSEKNVFCSRSCYYKQHYETKKIEKQQKANMKSNHELIVDIDREAKAHGMSYGKYVALMHAKG